MNNCIFLTISQQFEMLIKLRVLNKLQKSYNVNNYAVDFRRSNKKGHSHSAFLHLVFKETFKTTQY